MSPTPKKDNGWTCSCGTWNESSRTRCRDCKGGSSSLERFEFPVTGQQVRIVDVNGDPWFVASDVCAVLSIVHAASSLRSLDEDEKGVRSMHTLGGEQQVAVINEPGLYSLILRSRRPEAHAFKRWITHEVLPAIRQTGSYGAAAVPDMSTAAGRMQILNMAMAAEERALAAETKAAELEGPAHSWDVLASGNGDLQVSDAAKILSRDPAISLGRDRLFAYMAGLGWVHRQRSDNRWRAYQVQVDNGRLSELPQQYENPQTGELTLGAPQVRVTPKGLRELHKRLGGTADLRESVS